MKRFTTFTFIMLMLSFPGCKNNSTIPLTDPVINFFSISPTSIKKGESATLSWSVTNALSISIDYGVGEVSSSGSRTVTPDEDTLYQLTASNMHGTVLRSCKITVSTPANVVMVSGPTYMRFGSIFIAKGKTKNTGTTTANNVILYLYFYKKAGWGGGLYRECSWLYDYFCTGGEESEWSFKWDGEEGSDMCLYVDENNVKYKITWD